MAQTKLPSFLSFIFTLGLIGGCAYTPVASVPGDVGDQAAAYALAMVGTPYHYGGNSPGRGFDCSGLVQYSYGRAGVRVPRTTTALWQQSYAISARELRRGDLLFFNPEGKKSSHVAVYIGDNRFVHAPSTGKSVYVSSFNNPYWRQHFVEARRIESN